MISTLNKFHSTDPIWNGIRSEIKYFSTQENNVHSFAKYLRIVFTNLKIPNFYQAKMTKNALKKLEN